MALDVNASTFHRDVVERSRSVPVLVDFWAPWCGPCRTLGPILERLARDAGGAWELVKVNTDENQGLARQFGIQGIPAVKAFVDGKVVDEFVGALPESQIRAFLGRVVPDEVAVRARDARAAAERGDTATAERLYREVLSKDPTQPDALLFQAQSALAAGDRDAARAALARLAPRDRDARARDLARLELALEAPPLDEARAAVLAAPDDPAARYALATALAGSGDAAEALEILLDLVKKHRAWGDDAARKRMLQVFDLVGIRSPLADEYRSRLAMELFK